MSLTRFLPLPSDRMGILWSLLNIEDSVILEYGPAGTTHYSMGLFGELGIEEENRLFTTHLREEDVVMGDTSSPTKALLEIDGNLHPPVIFVVASSCSAVIGTDLRGLCTMVQPRVKARLVTFEQGGFRGDYAAGIRETYRLLAEQMAEEGGQKNPSSFNILGASAWSYRCKADVLELERLMAEAFGMKPGAVLCMETSLEKIASMGSAQINLVLRQEALPAAELLEKKCGTPFVYGAPYGYQGTLDYLKEVGKVLGKEINPRLEGEIKKKAMEGMQYRMYARMLRRDKPQALLYGEYETVSGLGAFLSGLGITPVKQISAHSLAPLEKAEEGIEYLPREKDRIEAFRSLEHTLVLADDTAKRLLAPGNTYLRIAMPLIDGSQVAVHMPLMGDRGADMVMEKVDEYYNSLR